ncbi:hypothetical protein Pfo_006979, partial [Paulownia fortunei]
RALTHPKFARKSAATLTSRKMCVILYSMLQRITFAIEGNLESVSLPPTNHRAVRSKPHSPPQSRVLLCPFQKLAQVHETMPQVQLPCLCILIPYESTNARRTWVTISRIINMHFELIHPGFCHNTLVIRVWMEDLCIWIPINCAALLSPPLNMFSP